MGVLDQFGEVREDVEETVDRAADEPAAVGIDLADSGVDAAAEGSTPANPLDPVFRAAQVATDAAQGKPGDDVKGESDTTTEEVGGAIKQAVGERNPFQFLGATGRLAGRAVASRREQAAVRAVTGDDEKDIREFQRDFINIREAAITTDPRDVEGSADLTIDDGGVDVEVEDDAVGSASEGRAEAQGWAFDAFIGEPFRAGTALATGVDPYGSGEKLFVDDDGSSADPSEADLEPTGETGVAGNLFIPGAELAGGGALNAVRGAVRGGSRAARGTKAMSASALSSLTRRGGRLISRIGDDATASRRLGRFDEGIDGSLTGLGAPPSQSNAGVLDDFLRGTQTAAEEQTDELADAVSGARVTDDIDLGAPRNIDATDLGPRTTAESAQGVVGDVGSVADDVSEEFATTVSRGAESASDTASGTVDAFIPNALRGGDETADAGTTAARNTEAGEDFASQSLLDRARDFFFGSRLRTVGTGAGLTGAGAATLAAVVGFSNEGNTFTYEVRSPFTGTLPNGGSVKGYPVEQVRNDTGESLGYVVYVPAVGSYDVVARDATLRSASASYEEMAAFIDPNTNAPTPPRLDPDFQSIGSARTTFREWTNNFTAGADAPSGGATPGWDGSIDAPRTFQQGQPFSGTATVTNTGQGAAQSARVGVVIQVNDQAAVIGESSGTVAQGSTETIEFSLSGEETAGLPAGEYPLILAAISGGSISARIAETTVGVEPSAGGAGDQDGAAPGNDTGRWQEAEIVRELNGGWYLIRQASAAQNRERWAVMGKTSGGQPVFLASGGKTTTSETFFEDRQTALAAHADWLRRQQNGNTSGPQPSESAGRPDPASVGRGGDGILSMASDLTGGLLSPVGIIALVVGGGALYWYSGGEPIDWVTNQAEDAWNTIEDIGGF